MTVLSIGVCAAISILFIRYITNGNNKNIPIGSDQNIRLWTVYSVFAMIESVIFILLFSGNFSWNKRDINKFVYIAALVVVLVLIEFLSPSRQLLFVFRKTPEMDESRKYEIEQSYDRFYQFVERILSYLMIAFLLIKVMLGIMSKAKLFIKPDQIKAYDTSIEYLTGILVLLFTCICFRQLFAQLSLIKKGYFRQEIFDDIRKKEDIRERLQARNRSL